MSLKCEHGFEGGVGGGCQVCKEPNNPEEEIQRYQDYETSGCYPLDDGDYVKYEDHAKALSAERERADRIENQVNAWASKVGEVKREKEALESKLKEAEKELETERLRLATCGVVGWAEDLEFAKVDDRYKSDSLDSVVNLINKLSTANAKIVELEKRQGCNHDNLETIVHHWEKVRTKCKDCGKTTFPTFEDEQFAIDKIRSLQAELSTANKKIEELENDNKILAEAKADNALRASIRENYALEKELDLANTKAEKLVEALGKYGKHFGDCDTQPEYGKDRSFVCTCGFEQAIKEFRGEK